MKKKVIEKMAAADAASWAAAEMFYGEGAGTRRKLVGAQIDQKMIDLADTDYADLFNLAYEHLDMNKFAEAAIKERKSIDRAAKATKNLNAIRRGNVNGLSTGLFLVAAGVWVARRTGYDKVVLSEAKRVWECMKTRAHEKKFNAPFAKED